jgi:hypothetical protein
MKTYTFGLRAGLSLLVAGMAFALPAAGGEKKAASPAKNSSQVKVGSYKLSGPHVYRNLTIFLIHGADQFPGKKLLTLQEAMKQKKIVVHEIQKVNELAIENLSKNREIFVQSGDIVKGGQQDRTIAFDLVVPPRSGKIPVASFCVEAGRWRKRAGESATRFETSPDTLTGKDKKMAVKGGRKRAQEKVWLEVAREQLRLARTLGKSVKSKESETSLALTLRDKKLLDVVNTYQRKLTGILRGKEHVIGYAFAINGQINSADIYGSRHLFRKLWPNLLKATVVEALAELKKGKEFKPVDAKAFKAFMLSAEKGKASRKDVTRRIRMVTRETKKNVLYVTEDRENGGRALRKNYFAK